MAASFTSLWPVATIVSVFVFLQRLQVYVFVPAAVQVAALVTFPLSQLWPNAAVVVCAFITVLHTLQ